MIKGIETIPYMGLGVGIWVSQIQPLLDNLNDLSDIDYLELYADDLVEIEKITDILPSEYRAILHGVGLSVIGADPLPEKLLKDTKRVAQKISAPWILEDLAVWRLDGETPFSGPFWPPIFNRDSLNLVISRVEMLTDIFERPFLCEVPPLDLVLGSIDVDIFFRNITEKLNCGLVLDVSHWLRYMQLQDISMSEPWAKFPMENIVELHISGGRKIKGKRWYDEEHSTKLLTECVSLLDNAISQAPNVRAITIESHGASVETLIDSIAKVNQLDSVKNIRKLKPLATVDAEASPNSIFGDLPSADIDLLEKQRAVKRLYEYPSLLLDKLDSPESSEASDAELKLDESENWLSAVYKTWKRKMDLPKITRFSIENSQLNEGAVYGQYLKINNLSVRDSLDPVSVAQYFANMIELPDWARDCCSFEADIYRVAAGTAPIAKHEVTDGGNKYLVEYPRSIKNTINTILKGSELPAEAMTIISMEIKGSELLVTEL